MENKDRRKLKGIQFYYFWTKLHEILAYIVSNSLLQFLCNFFLSHSESVGMKVRGGERGGVCVCVGGGGVGGRGSVVGVCGEV